MYYQQRPCGCNLRGILIDPKDPFYPSYFVIWGPRVAISREPRVRLTYGAVSFRRSGFARTIGDDNDDGYDE